MKKRGEFSGFCTRLALSMIRIYQKCVSGYRLPCCRFTPSCSQYAAEAIAKYGVVRGGFLSAYRILRCNPFCKGGYDPVK